MLPLASWGDGPALGLPGMAIAARDAWGRFASGQNPQPGDEVLAGLAMTGAGAFGLGGRAARGSVAGAERAEASSGLPSHSAGAGRLASNPPEAAPTGAMVSAFDQRLNQMRAAIDGLDPALQQTWRGDLDPGRFGVPSPFEFVQGQPYRRAPDSGQQVMVDLAKLKTNQPDVSGYAVKDIAERGPDPSLTPTRATQSEPTVARLEDGSYLVLGGNHRLSAAALKGETTAPATLFANAPDAAPVGMLPAMASAEKAGGLTPMDYLQAAWRHYRHPHERVEARSMIPRDADSLAALIANSDPYLPLKFEPPTMKAENANALAGTYKAAVEEQGGKPFGMIDGELYANPKDAAPAGLLATGNEQPTQQNFMLELLRRHGFIR
jgi:hypothetical protein